ncbi:lipid-A-disaccharide synthase [Candidatus Marithrix sp. Canyon 246]|uniref:lipid-A-disaccharide synthase n=1 Tax=Candidatus Marithrix sp. Canyon 246 TaxID=1827136 RepID=UPI00084A1452|nr:lipid-A-disaccharide synthase [Candidatus Marithrix sp. Canyon 246]
MRIAIVAGELSGDLLGSGLIYALKAKYPNAVIEGIGGPKMLAAGFHSHFPLETLSVMGLVEVLKHYFEIKKCHDSLAEYFLKQPPDVFIGIDAPDFNISLEYKLKQAGIPTVHYVSPSVWAWREYRLAKIARACDLMLTLFPFEADYYHQHNIPVCFVGHPLADAIPLHTDQQAARKKLGLNTKGKLIALLPGSRFNEVTQLTNTFLKTANDLLKQQADLAFIVPLANPKIKQYFIEQIPNELPIHLLDGQSYEAMAAADVILMASGTATLEAMLLKRPMVVAYRMANITYWLAKLLVHIPYISLPNLLAKKLLVPEFIQNKVITENLAPEILEWLNNSNKVQILQNNFTKLHHNLKQSANQKAAQAILSLISK